MMPNPFSPPHTLPQWLLTSLCWVVSCSVGFKLVSSVLLRFEMSDNITMLPIFGSAIYICVLMWRRVISVGWRLLLASPSDSAWLNLGARVWLALLILGFGVSSIGLGFGILMSLALSGESPNGSWQ